MPVETADHGKWSRKGIPHRDWKCVGWYDSKSDAPHEEGLHLTCDMCEKQPIRYVSIMEHEDWHEKLHCGCVCAANMEEGKKLDAEQAKTSAAGRREHDLKLRLGRRARFPFLKFWEKPKRNRYGSLYYRHRGLTLWLDWKNGEYWFGFTDRLETVRSKHGYATEHEAKLALFDCLNPDSRMAETRLVNSRLNSQTNSRRRDTMPDFDNMDTSAGDSRRGKRIDDLANMAELENKYRHFRLLQTNVWIGLQYWFHIETEEGTKTSVPRLVPTFDPKTGDEDKSIPDPYKDLPNVQRDGRAQKHFYLHAIDRDLQEEKGMKIGGKGKYYDKGDKTPVVIIRVPKGVMDEILDLSEGNEVKGEKYHVNHPKYGRDILLKYDKNSKSARNYWSVQPGDRTPLSKEEAKHKEWDLSELFKHEDDPEEDAKRLAKMAPGGEGADADDFSMDKAARKKAKGGKVKVNVFGGKDKPKKGKGKGGKSK